MNNTVGHIRWLVKTKDRPPMDGGGTMTYKVLQQLVGHDSWGQGLWRDVPDVLEIDLERPTRRLHADD